MAREYSRTQRVSDQIKRELASLIQLEIKDPRLGMVTVSAVEVSKDLAYAKVYVTFLAIDDQQPVDEKLAVLNHAAGFLRSVLAKSIKLRTIPQLSFYYDDSISRGRYLSSLIDKAMAADGQHRSAESGEQDNTNQEAE
ncbi:30S ribosome-binding factor RbfA [Endozoicomonas sp. SM1973]|uniref:Ribosome-binding factor A n=1 Tax=Spartinivicinus marinus TaxID=2994442 RepID=A0A853IE81_9GAMM|nr:30S ribosome-binding factor RbfA [Spartinivicinus marinus]MCX4027984.1 30S ribosome-binding factor RbfA [Spartinivicinus marinus]NYZ68261.1 30S ribosome-binding factor RbfA [Spartinivicinus marinus]